MRRHLSISSILIAFLFLRGTAHMDSAQADPSPSYDSSESDIVERIDISGNLSFSDDTILDGLAMKPPSGWLKKETTAFNPAILEADKQRILFFYKKRGYFSARIKETVITKNNPGKVSIHIVLDEGTQTRIESVAFQGLEKLGIDEQKLIISSFGLVMGDMFLHDNYLSGKNRIRKSLLAMGRAFATVDGQVTLSKNLTGAVIKIFIDPGPVTYFGDTIITTEKPDLKNAVLARITWKAGERFDPRKLDLTTARITRLGVFSSVRSSHHRLDQSELAEIRIQLAEGLKNELRAGIGAGIDRAHYEIRGRVAYLRRGFVFPLMKLRLEAMPAYMFLPNANDGEGIGGEATIGVEKEDFILPLLTSVVEISYAAQQYEAFSIHGLGLNASLARRLLEDKLTLSMGIRIRNQSIFDIHSAISEEESVALGLTSPYRLSYFEQLATYDSRQDPLKAESGLYLMLHLEEGTNLMGGSFDFVKATPEIRGYLAFGSRTVSAFRLKAGFTIAGSGVLPITQRYFSGGASSQRGFPQQRLSPYAMGSENAGVPIGGESLFETSLEIRQDVFKLSGNWIGLVAFLDGADVILKGNEIDILNLHWACGFGLRIKTLIGPIRFDLGFRLNRMSENDPVPQEKIAFHFSLGEAF